MYPWRRVLIPTDFSTASQWAFDDAIRMAGSTGAELVILHIRMTRASNPSELRFPADTSLYEYAEQHELAMLRERVQRANARVETRLVVKNAPDPGAEILRTAAEEKADLLVIATHARHHVAHLLIGSTTMSVISEPPAPTLAIRYGTPKRRAMKKIVVPHHPKQSSSAALQLARAIASREGGEVHLITVCETHERQLAEEHLARVETGEVANEKVILVGSDIEKEIVRYLEAADADALFINAQKELGLMKRDIIRRAAAPVMLVPA